MMVRRDYEVIANAIRTCPAIDDDAKFHVTMALASRLGGQPQFDPAKFIREATGREMFQ